MINDEDRILKNLTETSESFISAVGNELIAAKAWHTILNLLLVRHYLEDKDPIGLANQHCKLLADTWRNEASDEDVALQIERIYNMTHKTLKSLMIYQGRLDGYEDTPQESSQDEELIN